METVKGRGTGGKPGRRKGENKYPNLKDWAEHQIGNRLGKKSFTYICDYRIKDEKEGLVEFIFEYSLTGRLATALVKRVVGERQTSIKVLEIYGE